MSKAVFHTRLQWGGAWLIGGNFLILLIMMSYALSLAYPSTEAVRLRNAILMEPTRPGDFSWTPDEVPGDFPLDNAPASPAYRKIVADLGVNQKSGDLDVALTLAANLTHNAKNGDAIQSTLDDTYAKIQDGYGYCSDFTNVFLGLAKAAGLFSREWAFSFDGFGGHGHAMVEVFDRQRGKWIFIDVFNNFHVIDAGTGEPLSATEFHAYLKEGGRRVQIVKNGLGRFGFKNDDHLFDYYRRGANQWYLWWGNAVFAYDASPVVEVISPISRSAEQLAAIAVGVHPKIKVLEEADNLDLRKHMFALKHELIAMFWIGLVLSLILVAQIYSLLRRRFKKCV